jgi:hypothetical protein
MDPRLEKVEVGRNEAQYCCNLTPARVSRLFKTCQIV